MKVNDGLTVGDRIRNRRIELGLLQEDLAERAGYCGKSAISKLEHEGDQISMKQVRRLADALECTMEYLMGWQEPTTVKIKNSSVSSSDIPLAVDMFAKYKNASPEVQAAIDVLLKSYESDK